MKILLFLVAPLLLSASPKTPSDLTLTSTKDTVRLSWKDRASNEHGFKIFRDGKLIALTSANISTYTDRGLQPNRFYTYTIKATDDIPHGQTIKHMGQVGSHNWGKLNHYGSMTTLDIGNNLAFGARSVKATALNRGTIFASTDGSGELCSQSVPCSARSAFSKVKAGDVLFLRGGVYRIDKTLIVKTSGENNRPIVIESYPGEVATLDAGRINPEDVSKKWNDRVSGITLLDKMNYIYMRKLEIRNMGGAGIRVNGSYNKVEGCNIHNNFVGGIRVGDILDWHEDRPFVDGYNIIKDNIVHDNSDVGLGGRSGNGGNSDGIWVGTGKHNRIIHNSVYANSDDGVDVWRSNDSYVAYNISYDNGIAGGDGNGFKLGGHYDKVNNALVLDSNIGLRSIAEYNIAYDNKANGFDYNTGLDVIMRYNTSYNNGKFGYVGCKLARTEVSNNISSLDHAGPTHSRSDWGAFDSIDNSWDKNEDIKFISVNPKSSKFLVPQNKTEFRRIGIYAKRK